MKHPDPVCNPAPGSPSGIPDPRPGMSAPVPIHPLAVSPRKCRVAGAFDRAAPHYEARAGVQRQVARRLMQRIADLPLPPAPRVLEVGCGTGFLSRQLLRQWPGGNHLFTDLSPRMVQLCWDQLHSTPGEWQLAVMDGEEPPPLGPFHLIASNLAFQWFESLDLGLNRLVNLLHPGGTLAFATLGRDTFHEWRTLCDRHRIPCGVPELPATRNLGLLRPMGKPLRVAEERLLVEHDSVAGFLHRLKDVGAGLPGPGSTPATPGELRRLLRTEGERGFIATYHVVYGFITG